MRIFADANFSFIQKRRTAYMVSAVALLLSIGAMAWHAAGEGSWVNYGVDFRGGTLVQIAIDRPTNVAEVREVVRTVVEGPEVTRFGAETEFLIRAPAFAEEGTEVSEIIVAALTEHYGEASVTVERTEAVGPKIGAELQTRAMLALLLSFGATLIYLAFRFEWRFGVAAVIATVHDILLTLGLISILRLEVSLTTVAAVLTIIGYSLNDTIVVFDRARENLKARGRREDQIEIVNTSINETLPRTVMTSMTTIAALLALYFLGGSIIRDFALILTFGVIIGTYSSIFVASPALIEIEQRTGGDRSSKRQGRAAAV